MISIDSCGRASGAVLQVHRRSAANVGSITLRADGGGSTLQTCSVLEHQRMKLVDFLTAKIHCFFRVITSLPVGLRRPNIESGVSVCLYLSALSGKLCTVLPVLWMTSCLYILAILAYICEENMACAQNDSRMAMARTGANSDVCLPCNYHAAYVALLLRSRDRVYAWMCVVQPTSDWCTVFGRDIHISRRSSFTLKYLALQSSLQTTGKLPHQWCLFILPQ